MELVAQQLKRCIITAGPSQLANSSQLPALAYPHVTQDPWENVPQNHVPLDLTRCSPGQPFYQSFLPQTPSTCCYQTGLGTHSAWPRPTTMKHLYIHVYPRYLPRAPFSPPSSSPWTRRYWGHEGPSHTQ